MPISISVCLKVIKVSMKKRLSVVEDLLLVSPPLEHIIFK